MTIYAQIDADNTYLFDIGRHVPDGMGPPAPPPDDGFTYHLRDGFFDWASRPSDTCILKWNNGDPQWQETATIEQARISAWASVKAARDAAEAADFAFGGVLYQPDVPKITGAVLAALLPRAAEDAFSINWTVSDNSVVTLDAAQVMALGLTLTARINAIHQRGRTLRALIDNAATPQEAYGHTWDSLDADE